MQMLRCGADPHSIRASSSAPFLNGGAAESSCCRSGARPRPPSVTACSCIQVVSSRPTDPSTAERIVHQTPLVLLLRSKSLVPQLISNPRCCCSSYVDLKSWHEHPSLRRYINTPDTPVACKCHQEQISQPLLKFAKISDTFSTNLSRKSTSADGRRQLRESALTLGGGEVNEVELINCCSEDPAGDNC